jgi:serpin B
MAQVLALDPDAAKAADAAKKEHEEWASAAGKVQLRVANRLWGDLSLKLEPAFVASTSSAYGSTVQPLAIARQPEPSRVVINQWVEKQTNDRIKDLIPSGALGPLTRLVVTNAVYFDGKWSHPFDKAHTYDAPFTGAGNVPTMHETAAFGLAKADGMTMLEMPYQGSDLVMDVILPDAQDGLGAIEGKLAPATFGTWTKALQTQRVAVSLPKVKFSWGGSIARPLQALGMQRAFSDKADFRGIADTQDLRVSDVLHKAFVAIDEEGTEAAAATAVLMAEKGIDLTPVTTFKADHPFVFAIRDKAHDRILFIGRVTDPKG